MMALPQNGCQKFTFNNDYLIGAAPLPNNPDGGNKPGDSSPERCVSEADPAGFNSLRVRLRAMPAKSLRITAVKVMPAQS